MGPGAASAVAARKRLERMVQRIMIEGAGVRVERVSWNESDVLVGFSLLKTLGWVEVHSSTYVF